MMTSDTKMPAKLALLLLSLAVTVSFISCAKVEWESPNSADSPLIVNAGSYCLPVTILADSMFPWPLHLISNDTRFTFQSGFYITYQATYANDIMGCSGDVAEGLYVINFTLDNSSWSGPGLLYIQVSKTPIELYIDPIVTISSGAVSAAGPTFNLVSLSPWSDVTVSASLSGNDFTVSPSSITFRPNSTSQGFTFSTNGNTKSNSSITVTYSLSGTNKATYAFSQSTEVVNVPGGSNQSTSTNTTTNSTGGTNTTTNSTGGTNTTTNSTGGTNTTTNSTGGTNSTTNSTANSTGGTNTTTNNTGGTNTTTNSTGGTNTTNTTTNSSSGVATTTLTNSGSSINIIAGTYAVPLTLTTSSTSFKSNLWCTASTLGFMFNPQLVANSGSLSASAMLGASGTMAPGNYNVTFWCNDTKYSSPAPFKVKVTSGQVKIPKPDALTVKYVNGFTATSVPVTFDLSDTPPWQDITITPTPSDNNWIVFPSQVTITAAVKTASFVYRVNPSASGNFTTTVTFKIGGTNAASFAMAGTQTIKGVGKAQ